MTTETKPERKPSKADRLAEALRANLRRRKAPSGKHETVHHSGGKDGAPSVQDEEGA